MAVFLNSISNSTHGSLIVLILIFQLEPMEVSLFMIFLCLVVEALILYTLRIMGEIAALFLNIMLLLMYANVMWLLIIAQFSDCYKKI